MKRIFVVVDLDLRRAVRSFVSESRADDWSNYYTDETKHDSRVDEVWLDEVEDDSTNFRPIKAYDYEDIFASLEEED